MYKLHTNVTDLNEETETVTNQHADELMMTADTSTTTRFGKTLHSSAYNNAQRADRQAKCFFVIYLRKFYIFIRISMEHFARIKS